jgi:hypothetical protein
MLPPKRGRIFASPAIRGPLRYLTIHNPHVARLLGIAAARGELPPVVQDGWLKGFFDNPSPREPLGIILSLDVAAELPRWRPFARRSIKQLWSIRESDGLWDFPPAAPYYQQRPLSENWRRAEARRHDSSVRVLTLLRRYYD